MVRFRRKPLLLALSLLLLVLIVSLVLRSLPPEDSAPFSPALQTRPRPPGPPEPPRPPHRDAELEQALRKFPPPNYFLHAFYYAWYGNPQHDGRYVHWDHPQLPHWDSKVAQGYPQGRHVPPDDIGSNFYPALGAYSSRDPAVLENHMQQLRTAAIGVIAVSWYPPDHKDDNGEPVDSLMPLLMDTADRYHIKVIFHIEPYKDRNEVNMFTNVKYIIDKYGPHPAFFRFRTSEGKLLPLFYVYDSYLLASEQWARLLKRPDSVSGASVSLRDTDYDAVFVALLVEEKHKREVLSAGFDGLYTYFATNGFSYGSTLKHWDELRDFCDEHGLLFVPSVGPGYIDTAVRPWNFQNTRNRINGKYYESGLSAALQATPTFISITSFNEWHEGTQIETAVPKAGVTAYLDYLPNKPGIYLEITRKWAAIFNSERRQRHD